MSGSKTKAPGFAGGYLLRVTGRCESVITVAMRDRCRLIWCAVAVVFWSRAALQAEILVLRH